MQACHIHQTMELDKDYFYFLFKSLEKAFLRVVLFLAPNVTFLWIETLVSFKYLRLVLFLSYLFWYLPLICQRHDKTWLMKHVVVENTVVVLLRIKKHNNNYKKKHEKLWERYPSGIKILCGLGFFFSIKKFWNTSNPYKSSVGVIWNMWSNTAVVLVCACVLLFPFVWTTFSTSLNFTNCYSAPLNLTLA